MHICFLAPGAYSLLTEKNIKSILGSDLHQVILSRELIRKKLKISFIVFDDTSGFERAGEISIYKVKDKYSSVPIIDHIFKVFKIWESMWKADADIYFHHGGVAGIVPPYCSAFRKKFAYYIGSDALVDPQLVKYVKEKCIFNPSKFSRDRIGNWLDIMLADAVIIQNNYQKKFLKINYGREGVMIRKPIPVTDGFIRKISNVPIIIWVGSLAEVKQPKLFLKLAKAIPHAKFQMIAGNSPNEEMNDEFKKYSEGVTNFEFLGAIPFSDVDEYFKKSDLLVNTSMFEAYPPYAFLQAWMNYIPVVSLGDNSDALLTKYNMGRHSKTFGQMVKDINFLINNDDCRTELGVNGRKFIESQYNLRTIIMDYERLFNDMMGL